MSLEYSELVQFAWSQFWQIALLAVTVKFVVRWTCQRRPHWAYFLWLLVLVKAVTPPIWASPTGLFSWTDAPLKSCLAWLDDTESGLDSFGSYVTSIPGSQPTAVEFASADRNSQNIAVVQVTPIPNALRRDSSPPQNEGADVAAVLGKVALGSWLAGSLVFGSLIILRARHFHRSLQRESTAVPADLVQRVRQRALELGIRRPVRLIVVDRRTVPAVYGAFRPTILLPKYLLDDMSGQQLEAVIVHELIHIQRGDLWVAICQLAIQSLWWFHPCVWWANRETRRERERCCDTDVVRRLSCQPAGYARSLLYVLENARSYGKSAAWAGIHPFDITAHRLQSIMRCSQQATRPSRIALAGSATLFVVLVLPGLAVSQNSLSLSSIDPNPGANDRPAMARVIVSQADRHGMVVRQPPGSFVEAFEYTIEEANSGNHRARVVIYGDDQHP